MIERTRKRQIAKDKHMMAWHKQARKPKRWKK